MKLEAYWDNKTLRYSLTAVFFLVLLRFLWIGDASFINDEALILQLALKTAKAGKVFFLGLKGTKGLRYGPLPTWFYRSLLFISHDLIVISFLKITTVTSILVFSMIWLVRTLGLKNYYYLLPALTTPYLWQYSRNLWDNSLNISITALGFASYLAFTKHEKTWQLFVALACAVGAIMVHLMAVAFSVAIFIHFVLFKRRWIGRHLLSLGLYGCALLALSGHYFVYILGANSIGGGFLGSYKSLLFSLYGAKFFTTFKFHYFLGRGWQSSHYLPEWMNQLVTWAAGLTWLAYPICWFGLLWSLNYVVSGLRHRYHKGVHFHATFVAVGIFLLHTLLCFYKGIRSHPHYYNASWICYLFFLWMGISYFWKRGWFRYLFCAYTLVSAFMLLHIIFHIHLNEGNRELHYGPTLNNQLELARTINRYPDNTRIVSHAFHPRFFPHTIGVLRLLVGGQQGQDKKRSKPDALMIKYKQVRNSHGGLVLSEYHRNTRSR